MSGVRRVARALMAVGGIAVAALAFTSGPAQADDPELCGFVRYGTATTDTVPYLTYCDRPCFGSSGGGIGGGVPHTQVGDVQAEAFLCLRNV